MITIKNLKESIKEIHQQESDLYNRRYDLEKRIEKLRAKEILESGILKKFNWEARNEQRLEASLEWSKELKDYEPTKKELNLIYGDSFSYAVINLTENVSLSFNSDDGDFWLSSDCSGHLLSFLKEHEIEVDIEPLLGRKAQLNLQLNDLQHLIDTFGVE